MLLGLLWLRPLLLLYVLLLLLRRSIQRLAIQDVEQHLRAQTTVLLLGPAGQQHSKRMAQSVLQQSQHLGLDAKAGYGEMQHCMSASSEQVAIPKHYHNRHIVTTH